MLLDTPLPSVAAHRLTYRGNHVRGHHLSVIITGLRCSKIVEVWSQILHLVSDIDIFVAFDFSSLPIEHHPDDRRTQPGASHAISAATSSARLYQIKRDVAHNSITSTLAWQQYSLSISEI